MMKKQRSRKIRILLHQNGWFQVPGLGSWQSYWRDPYHLLLTVPWTGFILIIAVFYVAINAAFACAYLASGGVENARPGSFWDVFFFSVQTLASIGYGAMYPSTTSAHALVTLEALTGLLGIAVVTGLAFARFSRPTARVMFSQVAVVTPHDGVPTLMFRAANQRHNQILEARMQIFMLRDETTLEGHFMRRFHNLKLMRNQTPSFTLSWTVMHAIDPHSPLYGMTPEDLKQRRVQLNVSLSGVDETVAQMIHARHSYGAEEILWNMRFVDIFSDLEDGHRHIDYTRFHDVTTLTERWPS